VVAGSGVGSGLTARALVLVRQGFRHDFAIVPRLGFVSLYLRRRVLLHIRPMSRRRWRIAAIACALPAAMLLAGCGKKQAEPAVVGQVIAHVGPDEVTQQELDNELRLANVPADKRSDPVIKAALSRIVERKYLVQQAIAAKLDREPTVHLDLLRSHEQILAGAFVQRDLSAKMSGISKNEIDSYIQAHPKEFDQRELFQVDQISFPTPKDVDALAAATKDFKTLDQVEAKLNEMNIKFSRGTATLDSATMPPEMLKVLDARKPDDVYFIRSSGSASFFKVTSVDQKPMTADQANEFAKRQLRIDIGRKGAEAMSKEALADAKFEGDYARIMTAPAANGATPAPGTDGAAAPGAAPAPGAESAAPATETPGGETQKEQPKN
jgi:EpsD family peptidyl-prolyl cis-trans isomerase